MLTTENWEFLGRYQYIPRSSQMLTVKYKIAGISSKLLSLSPKVGWMRQAAVTGAPFAGAGCVGGAAGQLASRVVR